MPGGRPYDGFFYIPITPETEFIDRPSSYYYGGDGGGGIAGPYSAEQPAPYPPQPQQQSAQTLRRSRPFYSPSYTTYPSSTIYPMGVPGYSVPPITDKKAKRRHINQKYPVFVRFVLKIIQLIIATAILSLVLGPMQNYSFYDFVIRTQTEWQGAVVGIVVAFEILTLLFLVTIASRDHAWRKLDANVSCAGSFLYILVAFLESYFAACYPPNGKFHPEVCHRAEWIIASILAYFNIITYTADFILAFRFMAEYENNADNEDESEEKEIEFDTKKCKGELDQLIENVSWKSHRNYLPTKRFNNLRKF